MGSLRNSRVLYLINGIRARSHLEEHLAIEVERDFCTCIVQSSLAEQERRVAFQEVSFPSSPRLLIPREPTHRPPNWGTRRYPSRQDVRPPGGYCEVAAGHGIFQCDTMSRTVPLSPLDMTHWHLYIFTPIYR
jgi:hypothetical protein